MVNGVPKNRGQMGASMIEVLVTIVIVSLGLLGIAGLYANSMKFADDALQRHEAMTIAKQLTERIAANTANARLGSTSRYNFGTTINTAPGSGAFSTTSTTDCASAICTPDALADFDMRNFDAALRGASRRSGTNFVSALDAARGCVEFLDDAASTEDVGRFRVTVIWQGRSESSGPADVVVGQNCGKGLYGTGDKLRRLVSMVVVP